MDWWEWESDKMYELTKTEKCNVHTISFEALVILTSECEYMIMYVLLLIIVHLWWKLLCLCNLCIKYNLFI